MDNPVYFTDPDGMRVDGGGERKSWLGRAWDNVKKFFESEQESSMEIGPLEFIEEMSS